MTSPTIQDGFEMDEVPHFPPVPNNTQRERLPSLAEVNENNEEESSASFAAGESKSSDGFNLKEASRILESTSSSIQNIVEVDEAIKEASRIVGSMSSSVQNTVEVGEAKKVEGSPNDTDEVNTKKEDQERPIEGSELILCENDIELETKAKEKQDRKVDKSQEDDIDMKPLPPVKKVTFFEPSDKAIPWSCCCVFF